ncbi:Crp/Fnr family transcriptional regulator [Qipengyuania flava]|nr:Crp/Fnr family transcriptional regulator [Qipengyuania flava]
MADGIGLAGAAIEPALPEETVAKFIRTLRQRFSFSDEEQQQLISRMGVEAFFHKGDTLVDEGEWIEYSSLLFSGYACREKIDREGNRQIVEIQIPGDFVDLHSYPMEQLDHAITALTDCRIVKLYHKEIDDLIDKHPRFARLLWFSTIVDTSIHREWILNLGSRAGSQRMGHFLCEMYCRMEVVGLVDDGRYDLPLTQKDLGEALGFTPIHVNRTLKKLRSLGLADFRNQKVAIDDFDALADHCGFDASYLYLTPRKK